MVKILDFNCVRNFRQKVIVYMFSLIYNCLHLDFHQKYVFHKRLCSSSTFSISANGFTTTTSEK